MPGVYTPRQLFPICGVGAAVPVPGWPRVGHRASWAWAGTRHKGHTNMAVLLLNRSLNSNATGAIPNPSAKLPCSSGGGLFRTSTARPCSPYTHHHACRALCTHLLSSAEQAPACVFMASNAFVPKVSVSARRLGFMLLYLDPKIASPTSMHRPTCSTSVQVQAPQNRQSRGENLMNEAFSARSLTVHSFHGQHPC